jgi:hypothetical protein
MIVSYVPASAIWWTNYEYFKNIYSGMLASKEEGGVVVVEQHKGAQMMAGLCAGVVTTCSTNPMDVIKTRYGCTNT